MFQAIFNGAALVVLLLCGIGIAVHIVTDVKQTRMLREFRKEIKELEKQNQVVLDMIEEENEP